MAVVLITVINLAARWDEDNDDDDDDDDDPCQACRAPRRVRCPGHRGKSGSRSEFYLYCFDRFFAIQCACMPGFFYNRCIHTCDADDNFSSCPFLY
ncbi:hypothetical protein ACOMHN_009499 [Nucella lapillus]